MSRPKMTAGFRTGNETFSRKDLITQVEASSLGPSSSNHATPTTSNKKKKGKKITLMSTNVRRGA